MGTWQTPAGNPSQETLEERFIVDCGAFDLRIAHGTIWLNSERDDDFSTEVWM